MLRGRISQAPQTTLADLVTERLHNIPGILSTSTMIAFRAYSQRDLAAMWEIGLEEER